MILLGDFVAVGEFGNSGWLDRGFGFEGCLGLATYFGDFCARNIYLASFHAVSCGVGCALGFIAALTVSIVLRGVFQLLGVTGSNELTQEGGGCCDFSSLRFP